MQLFPIEIFYESHLDAEIIQVAAIPRVGDKFAPPNSGWLVTVESVILKINPAPGEPVAEVQCESDEFLTPIPIPR